ncbi:putative cysteine-rich receptor-like protein kinase 9 [Eucalyptus grandis]|uniref:putative cysteine-rich receptor-like protein kinase 9 n=1 Tax=Eucalyptus grandis TaxID=71139 RepID=UPI00192E7783|nr:putative cysteine-rich receptor-like protein kinase 9 [Eucalyptus grandis]
MEDEPIFTMSYAGNIANSAKFLQVLGDTIKDVAWRGSGNRFATAEANVTTPEKLYMIAQCTPDLTPWDCNTCLRSVIPRVPLGRPGGRIFTPCCNVRFDIRPFYNEGPAPGPPPPPPLPPEGIWNFPFASLSHYFNTTKQVG